MVLRRRRGPAVRSSAETVVGHYARVLDGETLWLAVEGDVTTVTLRYAGGEVVAPTEPEPGAGVAGLVGARVPLAALGDVGVGGSSAQPLAVAVLAHDGSEAAPITWVETPTPGPVRAAMPTRDRRWRWRVVAPDGRLGLVRHAEPPGAPVVRLVPHDDGLGVRIEPAAPHPPVDVRADEHDPAPGAPAPLGCGGLPLVRAHDDLRRPHHAVELPTLGDDLRLRWLPDGRLAVARDQR